MATNNGLQLSTVQRILDEVDEWYANVHRIRRGLSRVRRGSENYLDLLPDLSVETGVLKDKAGFAAEILEQYLESLPDPEQPTRSGDDSRMPRASCRE